MMMTAQASKAVVLFLNFCVAILGVSIVEIPLGKGVFGLASTHLRPFENQEMMIGGEYTMKDFQNVP